MRRTVDNFGVAKYHMPRHRKDKLQLKHILPKCDIFYFGKKYALYDIILPALNTRVLHATFNYNM